MLESSKGCKACTDPPEYRTYYLRRLLIFLSRSWKIIPQSLYLRGIRLEDRDPVNGGGYADIFRGSFQGQRVALKRLRHFSAVQKTEKEENVSTYYDLCYPHSHGLEGFSQRGSSVVVFEPSECPTLLGYRSRYLPITPFTLHCYTLAAKWKYLGLFVSTEGLGPPYTRGFMGMLIVTLERLVTHCRGAYRSNKL